MSRQIESVWHAANELVFVKRLRERLSRLTDGDEEVIRDTIEGTDKVDPLMEALLSHRNQALALAQARKDLAKTYTEAARADQARADKIEEMILDALEVAGVSKWKGIVGSASIRKGSWSTEILNAVSIPVTYCHSVPHIAKIKESLTALREHLDGCNDTMLRDEAMSVGASPPKKLTDEDRENLKELVMARSIPGARLVLGEDLCERDLG